MSAAMGFLGSQERVRNSPGKRAISVRATFYCVYKVYAMHTTSEVWFCTESEVHTI